MVAVSGIVTCAQCGHDSALPDESWLSITPLANLAGVCTTVCSGLCAVRWIEAHRKPTGLGVAL